jgi:hypothetical protein
MTFEEFINEVKELDISLQYPLKRKYEYEDLYFNLIRDNTPIDQYHLYDEHETGGSRGGSCWGGESVAYTSTEEDSQELIRYLDKILEKFCPSISYLNYKAISRRIQTGERTRSDYYGNYTNYKTRYISLKDLYDALVELKLLG